MNTLFNLTAYREAIASKTERHGLSNREIAAARHECADLPEGWSGRVGKLGSTKSRFIVGAKGAFTAKPHFVVSAHGPTSFWAFLKEPGKPYPTDRVDLGTRATLHAAFDAVHAVLLPLAARAADPTIVPFALHAARKRTAG